ncbi:hypothetical protein [Flavobacterium sp.]|uniref:hypothetical protein n=1 Tax=Flavobacterium sp. TaxID=239 RepID=UPI003753A9B4
MSVYKINDSIYSGLNDFKNSILVKFKIDFNYNNVKDLGKIKINKLYNNVAFHKYNTKKYVEDFEYEYDSISNVSIVHITQFKNKKKKKIVNEHYYIFSNNNNIENFEDKNIKNFIIKKYNIDAIKNQNLEKIICLFDGKKIFESKIINIKKINYTLSFSGAETSIKYGPITNFLHNNTTQ